MVLQLAEKFYGKKGLYAKAMSHKGRAVRQKAIELVAMVESGTMDFPENVRDYLDYARIGIEYHANHSGAFIDAGYVTRQQASAQSFGMQMV